MTLTDIKDFLLAKKQKKDLSPNRNIQKFFNTKTNSEWYRVHSWSSFGAYSCMAFPTELEANSYNYGIRENEKDAPKPLVAQ